MKKQWDFRTPPMKGDCIRIVLAVILVTAINFLNFDARAASNNDACSETSTFAKKACYNAANEVYQLALGKCENELESKQDSCEATARDDFDTSNLECSDQFVARQEICKEVGSGPYLPRGIKPFTFVSSDFNNLLLIGNLYYPLTKATLTYKSYKPGNSKAIETDFVQVTDKTRKIIGALCRVVQDTVFAGDFDNISIADPKTKIEETTDWFAQQSNGDVWYFGEIAQQFKQDLPDGDAILVGIDGSWTAGVDGAKPGRIMFADPLAHKDKTYRQEFALGEAEDDAKVIGIVKFGVLKVKYPILSNKLATNLNIDDGTDILHTQDFSALDPGSVLAGQFEDKYYAPNVGVILIVPHDGTEVQEVLVDYKKP
jgi:hypothetical protein